MESLDIEWQAILMNLYQLGLAFVIALPVAWNREYAER